MNSKNFFHNKSFLITGGTGSFGYAMVKELIKKKIKEIRIFSRDEKKQDDMRKYFNSSKIKFYIGDVREKQSLNDAITNCDFIFHAAALKQVPSCEFYPMEAVKTNIIGASNVLEIAIANNIRKVVCLSTDKAVNPINAMGLSKSMMEKVVIAKSRSINKNTKTELCITRYGNVIGSRGSVIPLFLDLIKNKKPLTVTSMKMTRFMMTMQDAIDLVFFAFKKGKNGDIYVKKSPAASIETVIKSISSLLGVNPKIKVIGPRHGEKFHETLLNKEEMIIAKNLNAYYLIPTDKRDLNYDKYFSKGIKSKKQFQDYSSNNTKVLNIFELNKLLKKSII